MFRTLLAKALFRSSADNQGHLADYRILSFLDRRLERLYDDDIYAFELRCGQSNLSNSAKSDILRSTAVTITTSLIVDLIKGANAVQRLRPTERRQLLERGLSALAALRGLLAKTGKVIPMDRSAEREIKDISRSIEQMSDETVSKSLLALAEQIRTLRILNREDA